MVKGLRKLDHCAKMDVGNSNDATPVVQRADCRDPASGQMRCTGRRVVPQAWHDIAARAAEFPFHPAQVQNLQDDRSPIVNLRPVRWLKPDVRTYFLVPD